MAAHLVVAYASKQIHKCVTDSSISSSIGWPNTCDRSVARIYPITHYLRQANMTSSLTS